MKLILHFMKPYRLKFALICLLLAVDTVGALAIPTIAAEILNLGTGTTMRMAWVSSVCTVVTSDEVRVVMEATPKWRKS